VVRRAPSVLPFPWSWRIIMLTASSRRSQGSCLLLAVAVLLAWGPLRAAEPAPAKKSDNPALQAAAALYADIRTETLPNGLRVFLKPIKGSPVVSTMVAYKVGSSDEDLTSTGLSHYLEHLMFKGTDKIKPGDIDRATLRNGGANNAYTTEDCTIYHFDFAADRWEVALEVEADRMRNLRIDEKHEFEQEKGAVIAELERDEDEPWDLEQKAIVPLLFGKNGPYGHPVIGERDHVHAATAEIIKGHYDRWYYPNNAALVVTGGFDPDKALARIKELFGPLPMGKLPERKALSKEKLQRPARYEFDSKFESPRMLLGFNTITTADPDNPVLDVIQSLLTGGKTGRLYKKLVEEEEIASSVSASNNAGRYPGWFSIQVELLPGKSREEAEKLVLAELKRLRDEPVTEAELQRVQQTVLTDAVFGRESVHALADSIARAVTIADLETLRNYLPRILAVTAADVQKAARKYFDPEQRVIVWSVPKAKGKGAEGGKPKGEGRKQKAEKEATEGEYSLKDAKRVVLPNGLVLLLYEKHRLPIVVAEAMVRQVSLRESEEKAGVAVLVGSLLDEGTSKHSSDEIAELIENAGATLSMTSSGGSVRMLATHRHLGLEMLLECLSKPTFPEKEFKREKERQLAEIEEAEQQPETKALMVYREMVYGKHPFGRPSHGLLKTVEGLTRNDCVEFHRRVFVPNNTILVVVGDFDSKAVADEITQLTADWKKAELEKPKVPEIKPILEFTTKVVSMPEAAQLHFYLGHLGIRRTNPDYYKLLVMDYILGTGPGFTDMLSSQLRDREGLGYTVSGTITSSAGEEPGLFTCYIGTQPRNFERVKKEMLEILNRLRDEPPPNDKFEGAKMYLLGSLPFQLTTIDKIAERLLYAERYGLGFDYLDDYRKGVAAVTPADIQAVAKKYIDPEHLVVVAAGAIDGKGKPLLQQAPPKP
jgi:zinc protease